MFDYFVFFLIPVIAFSLATLIKLIVHWHKHGFDLGYSIAYGHMPSGHTAFVTSLVATIGTLDGWHTPVSGLSVCFAVIVILDALRLRVWMGQHAAHINRIVSHLNLDEREFPRLKERIGHKPVEVLAGGLLGIGVTFAMVRLFL